MRKLSETERAEREAAASALKQAQLAASTDPNRLTCLECGWHAMNSLQKHVERQHCMTPTEYKAKFSVGAESLYGQSLRKGLSEKVTGDKNPAFNHGGRLSPFSKSFVKYADEVEAKIGITKAGDKVRQAQLDHGNTKLKHYLNKGLSLQEAKAILADRQQTFTLEKCIKRHGFELGYQAWYERQERWQETIRFKSVEEIERINNSKIWKSGGVSKQSIQLFEQITTDAARWSASGGEACLKLPTNKHIMLDFVLGNKVIEYFGTYWHADPRFYKDDSIMIMKRSGPESAKSIRLHDDQRLNAIKDAGYQVLVIWEHDFMTNPAETISKCKTFLQT